MHTPNGITRVVLGVHALASSLHDRGFPRAASAIAALGRVLTGAEIRPSTRIGSNLVLYHAQSLVIGEGVQIGDNCVIHHEVTLGLSKGGFPQLGDGVTIYPGAKLFGPIHVGDGATVGANSVVTSDVAPGITVAGVPAGPVGGATSDRTSG